jgi:tRNA-dihydrouridine synthase B
MSNFWQQFTKPILALAPMCGVTDLPFRLICKELGADLVYSEMIMVQSLARRNPSALRLAEISPDEQPVIIQLGGREPEHFRTSARMVKEIGADGIDINFGCPAKKIAGNGSGVALLRDLQLARDIIEATLEGADGLPLSIKTRTSIKLPGQNVSQSSLDLLDFIKDLPISAVMIHGRSFESPWSEEIDHDYIKEVKRTFKGVVLANGGIYEPEQAQEVLELTGADGVGIGHGVYGRPWIFDEIRSYIETGHYDKKSWSYRKAIALRHLSLCQSIKGDKGLPEFKKQLLWYIKGLPGASAYREKMSQINNLADFENALNEFPADSVQ